MKTTLTIVFFILYLLPHISFSQIYVGDVDLTTQSQVNSFGQNNYTGIDGNLTINGGLSINNLNPLSALTNVTQDLIIANCDSLANLSGLNNLTSVGNDLILLRNDGLTTLLGLNNLLTVGGSLRIGQYIGDGGNINLTSLNALNNLNSIGQDLEFADNPLINDLTSFSSITELQGYLFIRNNDNLTNLNGLQNITSLGGGLFITYNENLVDLDDLQGLNTIGQNIVIDENPSLSNLEGLINIHSVGTEILLGESNLITNLEGLNNISHLDGHLWIINMNILENLDALSQMNYIGGDLDIKFNDNLGNFCGLTNLIVSGTLVGDYDVVNNEYNPTLQNILNGECTNQPPSLELSYPHLNDIYISGEALRLEFVSTDNLPNNTSVQISYSIDNGGTWIFDNTFLIDSNFNGGYTWTAPIVTVPQNVLIRLEANIFGNIYSFITPNINIQPVNYYINQGFNNTGTSHINFPFEGLINTSIGWYTEPSLGHLCLDENAQDWNYFFNECGKDIRSPIQGQIIFLERESTTLECGPNPNIFKYEKQIVIQSSVDKTMAFRVAHLKNIPENITVGTMIEIGDLIGQVGSTGTEETHAHCSLYKNIYGWYPIDDPNNHTNTIKELLEIGSSFTNDNYPDECNYAALKHSAEFDLETLFDNIVSTIEEIIPTNSELQNLISNQYTSLISNLIIGPETLHRNDIVISNLKSSDIVTLNGLETVLSIDGDLIIKNTDILNLNGFQNLTHVGGNVVIQNNNQLVNFCGLYKLIFNDGIGGELIIEGNAYNPTSLQILDPTDCEFILNISDIDKKEDILIYPNPFNQIINISYPHLEEVNNIEIFNIAGAKLLDFKEAKEKINLEKLSVGLYFIRFSTVRGGQTIKLLKE